MNRHYIFFILILSFHAAISFENFPEISDTVQNQYQYTLYDLVNRNHIQNQSINSSYQPEIIFQNNSSQQQLSYPIEKNNSFDLNYTQNNNSIDSNESYYIRSKQRHHPKIIQNYEGNYTNNTYAPIRNYKQRSYYKYLNHKNNKTHNNNSSYYNNSYGYNETFYNQSQYNNSSQSIINITGNHSKISNYNNKKKQIQRQCQMLCKRQFNQRRQWKIKKFFNKNKLIKQLLKGVYNKNYKNVQLNYKDIQKSLQELTMFIKQSQMKKNLLKNLLKIQKIKSAKKNKNIPSDHQQKQIKSLQKRISQIKKNLKRMGRFMNRH